MVFNIIDLKLHKRILHEMLNKIKTTETILVSQVSFLHLHLKFNEEVNDERKNPQQIARTVLKTRIQKHYNGRHSTRNVLQ